MTEDEEVLQQAIAELSDPGPLYHVRYGGLYRCCIMSLDQEMERRHTAGEPLMKDGDVCYCKFCSQGKLVCDTDNILNQLSWRWDKPKEDQ